MIRSALVLAGIAWTAIAVAQPVLEHGASVAPDAYARIEVVRSRETALLNTQEAQCYQRFAVNACLTDVQTRRRALLADLRRQESALHDLERAQKGNEQVQRTNQKAWDKPASDMNARGSEDASIDPMQAKLQAQEEKKQKHAALVSAVGVQAQSRASEPVYPGVDEQARNRASYRNKLAEAEKKRQEVIKRQAEKAAKPVPPLPVPP